MFLTDWLSPSLTCCSILLHLLKFDDMFFSSEKASLFKKKIVLSFIPIFSPISVQRVQRKSSITSCTLNLGRINWASRIVPRFVRDEEVELTSTFPLFNMFFYVLCLVLWKECQIAKYWLPQMLSHCVNGMGNKQCSIINFNWDTMGLKWEAGMHNIKKLWKTESLILYIFLAT